MKYLILLIPGSLLGLLLLISCDYIEVPPPDLADTLQISAIADLAKAEIVVNENPNEINDPSRLEGTGNMNGIDPEGNLFRFDCFINMTHLAWYDEYRNILIEEGKFSLISDQGSDYLQGNYSGGGREEGNETVIGLVLTVTGGSGKFAGATGTLNAEWIPAQDQDPKNEIRYSGMILLPENN